MTTPSTIPRPWGRLGLYLAAVFGACSLLLSVFISAAAVFDARRALIEGQATTLVHAIHERLASAPAPMSQEALEQLLSSFEEAGLRAVALYGPDGEVEQRAGEPSLPFGPLSTGMAMSWEESGPDRIRVTWTPPVAQPASRAPGYGPPLRGPPPGPPAMVFELEPVMAEALSLRAVATLIAGVLGAILLLVAAVLVDRQLLARQAIERRLAEERRFATIGEMSATVAHQLRNPLAAVKGHAQLLSMMMAAESKERKKAEGLLEEIARLEALSNGLLDFVRSGRIQRMDCELTALVQDAVERSGVSTVKLQMDEAPARWSLDRMRLAEVLINLLQNAEQASAPGAEVELEVSQRGAVLQLTVRDRGEGFAESEVERLFEPFVTTRVQGVGLGLAIARQIVRGHGGELSARPREGGGAQFQLEIPRG